MSENKGPSYFGNGYKNSKSSSIDFGDLLKRASAEEDDDEIIDKQQEVVETTPEIEEPVVDETPIIEESPIIETASDETEEDNSIQNLINSSIPTRSKPQKVVKNPVVEKREIETKKEAAPKAEKIELPKQQEVVKKVEKVEKAPELIKEPEVKKENVSISAPQKVQPTQSAISKIKPTQTPISTVKPKATPQPAKPVQSQSVQTPQQSTVKKTTTVKEAMEAAGIDFFSKEDLEMAEAGALLVKLNPNPDKSLIAGKNFNDPSLDAIYGYTESPARKDIKKRKAIEKAEREAEAKRLAEEEAARLEELEKKRGKFAKKLNSLSNKNKTSTETPENGENTEQLQQEAPAVSKRELKVPDKYPKTYADPTDMEIDEKTGRKYYYFNFGKTLDNSSLKFLSKILPVNAIDEVFYDKPFLDGIAEHQHQKSVRLNNMSASEQYIRDIILFGSKIAVAVALLIAVSFKMVVDIIPEKNYNNAIAVFQSKNYEQAYYDFDAMGDYELSQYLKKYSEGKMYLKTEKFSDAKETFQMLLPYQDEIFTGLGIDLNQDLNECNYQIALVYYYDGQFEMAKDIFKNIHTYADSTEYYYKCGYKIADKYYEENNLIMALKYFYQVRNSSENDAEDRIVELQELLYNNGQKAYGNQEYEEAMNIFNTLAKYGYSDASYMSVQCSYKYALDLYDSRQYEKAKSILMSISTYKDSYALAKECTYNVAEILYENNPVQSLTQYESIVGFKDVNDILASSIIVLYGSWDIVEMNGGKISPIGFDFYGNGEFRTTKQISDVAISTNATAWKYDWDGYKFSVEGYTMTPVYDQSTGLLTLTCSNGTTTTVYTCKRTQKLDELKSSITLVDTDDTTKTPQQIFEELISEYVDKKTDGRVFKGGKQINVLTEEVDLN